MQGRDQRRIIRVSSSRTGALAISRVATVVIIVVILAIAGGAAYFVSTLTSSSTTTTSSSSAAATTSSSSSSISHSLSPISSSSASSISSTIKSSVSSSSASSSLSCPSTNSSVASNATTASITIGYNIASTNTAALGIAQALGIFTKYGLHVTTTQVPSAPNQAAGVESGAAQIGTYLPASTLLNVFAANPDANLVGIAFGDAKGVPFYLVVNPSITTPQDLVGKSVAANGPAGSPSDLALQFILGAFGMNETQVKTTYVASPNTELTALLAGSVSGAVLSPPRNIEAMDNGFKQLGPASTDTAFAQPDIVITSKTFLASNPGVVRNFLMAYLEAYHLLYLTMNAVSANSSTTSSNTAGFNATQIIDLLSTYQSFNTTLVTQTLQIYQKAQVLDFTMQPDNATFEFTYHFALSKNPTIQSVNVSSIFDFSIINELNAPCGFVYSLYGGSPPPLPPYAP